MTEAMPIAPQAPPGKGTESSMATGANAARRTQFLSTEHWSLLATRSMSWNESALVTLQVTPAMASAVPVGLIVAGCSVALCLVYARRDAAAYVARMIGFQTSMYATAERRREGGTS